MDRNPNTQPVDNDVQGNSDRPDWTHAQQRATVIVTRNGRQSLGQLVFWPGDKPRRKGARVKVMLASGNHISVEPSEVTLLPTITS
jgi:hypothetical protein